MIYDPKMHNLCINMQPSLIYIEIIHITGRKNLSVICKDPVSKLKKTDLFKEAAFLKLFFLLMFFDENNIAKLLGDL